MYGTYNHHGYAIWCDDADEPLYTAGNSRFDSQGYVDPVSISALSLPTIKAYCESTGTDMSREQGETWRGCEYEEESA